MSFQLEFSDNAKEDIAAFKKAGNKAVLKKLFKLLNELSEDPFTGTGKPEMLKHQLTGCWSRRVSKEHRLVYLVSGDRVFILSVRGHY